MTIVSLLTDFGVEDEYVGVMKAVILSVNPAAVIVDLTHQIPSQNIFQAAQVINESYRFFPEKSIHVIVVDPGVGSDRAILAYEKKGHIFIAPDNGVLTLLAEEKGEDRVYLVQNPNYFLNPVSRTFHGRDIFAPVAAHLSKGVAIERLGPMLDVKNITRLTVAEAFIDETGAVVGHIVSVDHFGNLITNIDLKLMDRYGIRPENATIVLGNIKLQGIHDHYSSVNSGNVLAIIGSRGLLEIAVNQGNARKTLHAAVGELVRIKKSD